MRIEPGMTVDSRNGNFGTLADVVVDPVRRRLTHLVVQPSRWWQEPRLVTVEAMTACEGHVKLSWPTGEIINAPAMQESSFPGLESGPQDHRGMDVGVVRVFAWPSSPATDGLWWSEPGSGPGYGSQPGTTTTTYDMMPKGTAEIRRASEVTGSDGRVVGHVYGLIMTPDFSITDVVIARGHLWTHREITVPIDHVGSIGTDELKMRVPRKTVLAFPSVHHHRRQALRRVEVDSIRRRPDE
jgi:sporulation protein YlmC with PRC-barrel domain